MYHVPFWIISIKPWSDYNVMKNHTLKHTGKKTNKCNLCDYATVQKNNLKTHMLTHTGEKPHKCKHCDYSSHQASNLKVHIETHRLGKFNKCTQCNYTSVHKIRRWYLQTHSGEKPHKCNICHYESIQATHLKEHMKTHKRKTLKIWPIQIKFFVSIGFKVL